jgi:hypothetical protein
MTLTDPIKSYKNTISRRIRNLAIATTFIASLAAQVYSLGGQVTEVDTGLPLPDVTVTVESLTDTSKHGTVVSDDNGFYNFDESFLDVDDMQPLKFGLGTAYPNPANPAMSVPFAVSEWGEYTVQSFNLRGQLLFEKKLSLSPGTWEVEYGGSTGNQYELIRINNGKAKKVTFIDGGNGTGFGSVSGSGVEVYLGRETMPVQLTSSGENIETSVETFTINEGHNEHNITLDEQLCELRITAQDFYQQLPIENAVYTLQKMNGDGSMDEVMEFNEADGDITLLLPYGTYELNVLGDNTWDGASWMYAPSYLGLKRAGDETNFESRDAVDFSSPITINSSQDQIFANKVPIYLQNGDLFNVTTIVGILGGQIVAFGNEAQDAPAWIPQGGEYLVPDESDLQMVEDYRQLILGSPFNRRTLPLVMGETNPGAPVSTIEAHPNYPGPGTNSTSFNEETGEIEYASAAYPSWSHSHYTHFIERWQADYRGFDDPDVFALNDQDQIVFNETGNQCMAASNFWGANYHLTVPSLARFMNDQYNNGNTSITKELNAIAYNPEKIIERYPVFMDYVAQEAKKLESGN